MKKRDDAPATWLCSGGCGATFALSPEKRSAWRHGQQVFYHSKSCANQHTRNAPAPVIQQCKGCGKDVILSSAQRYYYRRGQRVFYHGDCALHRPKPWKPGRKPTSPPALAKIVAPLLTMQDAATWIDAHKDEFRVIQGPKPASLKTAAESGRLTAVKIGGIYVTREVELREYMAHFDPKNRSGARTG